jgi:phage baseplate assembly protein V
MYGFPENRDSTVGTLRRARVEKIDDSGAQQIMKRLLGMSSDEPEDVYRAQSHGFTSHPPAGSEGLFLALGGRSDRLVGLGFEHKDKRPKDLPEGGTALYDADGKVLKFIKDETTLDAGGKPIKITNASTVLIEGASDVAVGVKDGRYVRIRPGRVDLGVTSATAEASNAVMTDAGPSSVVFAVV